MNMYFACGGRTGLDEPGQAAESGEEQDDGEGLQPLHGEEAHGGEEDRQPHDNPEVQHLQLRKSVYILFHPIILVLETANFL